jgi:hypothetical protein
MKILLKLFFYLQEAALECQNAAMASNDFIQKEIQKEQVRTYWAERRTLICSNDVAYNVFPIYRT